jgi:hypothetical protein
MSGNSLFRKLEGCELESAKRIWAQKGLDKIYGRRKGLRKHCPCGGIIHFSYIDSYRKGKTKPLVGLNILRLMHCTKCDSFYSASLMKLKDYGYACRYEEMQP